MEEESEILAFSHRLPVFGVECFGSALIDDGRFSRAVGFAPAPPVVRYDDGGWLVERHWITLARHQLNAEPGAWVSTLVDASERHTERAVSSFDANATPEHVANGLCELYGVMAAPMLTFSILGELLERRMRSIFKHAGIAPDQEEAWLGVFRYPERKTASMEEHEAIFSLASFVRKHAMDRSTRERVGAYTKRYGYLGLVTPSARTFSFTDMLHRVSKFEEKPEVARVREEGDRTRVLGRARTFMNNIGLHAPERDAIRAYRDVAYWQLRQKELWALMETAMRPGVGRLAAKLDLSEDQILSLRVEELSHALLNPKEIPAAFELDERLKKKCSALFVEDIVELHWS